MPTEVPPVSSEHAAAREAKGSFVNLLTVLAPAALPALHVQLGRVLGDDGYGLFIWSNALVDMLSMLTLMGMDVALSKQVAIAHAAGDAGASARATGTALRVVLLSGAVVALFVGVAAPFIAGWKHEPRLVAPLRMFLVVPLAYHVATVLLTATQAKLVMRYDFWARGIAQPLLLLGLTTLSLRLGYGVAGAAGAVALGMTIVAALVVYFYGREFSLSETLRACVRGPVDWGLVRVALPLVAINFAGAVQGKVDSIMLVRYLPFAEVGAYGACYVYAISIGQVRGAFYPVTAATMPTMLAKGQTLALNAFLRRQTRWIAILAFPLVVLFAGFGDGLLAVFGPEYMIGRHALTLLALAQLTHALNLASFALVFSGHVRIPFVAVLVCITFQVVAFPLLVPRFGLTGAALSALLGLLVSNGLQVAATWHYVRVHPFSVGVLKVAAAAAAGYGVGRALYTALPLSMFPRFLAGVGVAAVVYLVALVALGLTREERHIVRAQLASVREFLARRSKVG